MKTLAVTGGCCGPKTAPGTAEPSDPGQIRTEHDLARAVEIGRGNSAFTKTFLALLDERHAVYHGVATPAVVRMRGALLLALGHHALPVTALPFVLEELESAHDASLTAIAARVLRKFPEPSAAFAEPLLSALSTIRHRDEIVRFPHDGQHTPGAGDTTTATSEVITTIAWLGRAGASCVPRMEQLLASNPGPSTAAMLANAIEAIRNDGRTPMPADAWSPEDTACAIPSSSAGDISGVRFQDHSGTELTFADAFHGRPSIVVFFYTRCDNPAKCPLTMYRFGNLQRLLQESGLGDAIGMGAITYDPQYDRAERLSQYAESWGAKPSAVHRILRTVGDFAAVSDYFALGVNFSASGIVNRHQLEAFVLDRDGRIAHAVTRRRWDEAQLLQLASTLLT